MVIVRLTSLAMGWVTEAYTNSLAPAIITGNGHIGSSFRQTGADGDGTWHVIVLSDASRPKRAILVAHDSKICVHETSYNSESHT